MTKDKRLKNFQKQKLSRQKFTFKNILQKLLLENQCSKLGQFNLDLTQSQT